jgi:hypothetical protein
MTATMARRGYECRRQPERWENPACPVAALCCCNGRVVRPRMEGPLTCIYTVRVAGFEPASSSQADSGIGPAPIPALTCAMGAGEYVEVQRRSGRLSLR